MSDFAYLSIVIPVFDEEENVCPLAKEIVSALSGICDYEIIFVNDSSIDNTDQALSNLKRKSQPRNPPLTALRTKCRTSNRNFGGQWPYNSDLGW